MPPRRWRQRVEDILEAAVRIVAVTSGADEVAFGADRVLLDAVCMNLIVIGEAARHVPDEVLRAHPEIPWAEMRDMRNLIAHEYFGISARIVWRTATTHVPGLIPGLRALLDSTAAD